MGVESIKDIYQYPTVRTWRRHSRTPCSMLTRGDLAKRAEVVDVESGKLPAPECSWMMALRIFVKLDRESLFRQFEWSRIKHRIKEDRCKAAIAVAVEVRAGFNHVVGI